MAIDKNAVIKEAQKFAAKGQFDKAIAEWKKLAKESSKDANIFNTIGDLCLKKNAKADAVDAYKKAADILASDGFTSKAIALYKKVLNIDPKKIEAHLALADMNAEKGLTGNALESYKLVADHYAKNKETGKALAIYQKMADLNATNVAFRLKLAEMYVKEGMKKEAIKAYLQAADVHVSKDAFNDARQLFEKALALDANNKDVYHKAGLVYFKEGKFVEACKALKPAFESDPENEDLTGLYLDALTKAGRSAEAEEAYQTLLSKNPERHDLREKLYRFYLDQQDYDKAFAEVSSLANNKIEEKDFDSAEEILKGFITAAPSHVDGRRALSAVYKTVGKGEEGAAVLLPAAQVLIENGDQEGARDLLSRALDLSPHHEEARRLKDGLQQQAPEPVAEAKIARDVPTAAPASMPAPSVSQEEPSVAEAITEADVLIKYGLATKAVEQLETLAKKFPQSIQVRIKLRDVYGDLGNMSKAVSHMLVLSDLYARQGRQDQADQVLRAALEMDPNNAQIKAKLGVAGTAAEPGEILLREPVGEAPILDEFPTPGCQPADMADDLGMRQTDLGDVLSLPDSGPGIEEPAQPSSLSEEISFDQPFAAPDLPVEEKPEHFSSEAAEMQPQSSETWMEQPGAQAAEQEAAVPEEIDISEIWAEAEFYYQQGLLDEARNHYEKIVQYAPGNAQALRRIEEISKEQEESREFSKLSDAVDGLEGYAGAAATGEMAASASDEEAVRLLMQEIAQLKQKATPAKERPAPVRPKSRKQADANEAIFARASSDNRPEEDFFDIGAELSGVGSSTAGKDADSEEDFFDLASELRDELSSISIPPPSQASAENQSLDDIFEEFKRGVEQQAIKEDADTHYNLGIAYKEMGLLDDAIAEFTMTTEDEPKFIQSRSMLGLCYMEKGDYQNAIVELQRALTTSDRQGWPAMDRVGMFYDLGLAYQGSGNNDTALRQFQRVCEIDPGYRDAMDKMSELEQGGEISLEQLKDDIEKEISSKFLEEGERIEREEKTRKNEKVRS